MTRTRKIYLIKKFRPYIYSRLECQTPNLLKNPDTAPNFEIHIYNTLIKVEADSEKNPTFFKRFSF